MTSIVMKGKGICMKDRPKENRSPIDVEEVLSHIFGGARRHQKQVSTTQDGSRYSAIFI